MRKMPYRPLGALRLFLAMLVVAQHYLQWCFPGAVQRAVMPFEPGSTAVLVFFVLSGFIITEAADRIYVGRPLAFACNRFLRIVPLFLAALALCFAVLAFVGREVALSGPNIVANALEIVPLPGRLVLVPDYSVLRIAWALRMECAFYVAVAALLIVARRPSLHFVFLSTAATVLVVSGYAAITHLGESSGYVRFAPFFICGCAYYFCMSGSRYASLIALAAFAASLRIADAHWPLFFGLTAIAAALARVEWTSARFDKWLGDLSYPVYLGHWVALAPFDHAPPPTHPWLILTLGLLTPLVLLLSIEPGIRSLRDRVRQGPLG